MTRRGPVGRQPWTARTNAATADAASIRIISPLGDDLGTYAPLCKDDTPRSADLSVNGPRASPICRCSDVSRVLLCAKSRALIEIGLGETGRGGCPLGGNARQLELLRVGPLRGEVDAGKTKGGCAYSAPTTTKCRSGNYYKLSFT